METNISFTCVQRKQKFTNFNPHNLYIEQLPKSLHLIETVLNCHSGLKHPPSCFGVYLENKEAYLKQETSEIVVKSIHHSGFLFNFIMINLKSSENKER